MSSDGNPAVSDQGSNGVATIDGALVRKIANASKLDLTDQEVDNYTSQLKDILGHMQKLSKVNTENIKPTYQVGVKSNVMRTDVASVDGLVDPQDLLRLAPHRHGEYIESKKVL